MTRDRVVQALTFLLPSCSFRSLRGLRRSADRRAESGWPSSTRINPSIHGSLSARSRQRAACAAPHGECRKMRAGPMAKEARSRADCWIALAPKRSSEGRRAGGSHPSEGIDRRTSFLVRPTGRSAEDLNPADVSDPIAPQMVLGLLQKVAFTAAPSMMATEGHRDVREVQRAAYAGPAQVDGSVVAQMKKGGPGAGGGTPAGSWTSQPPSST